ncbi:MAG: DNA ligase LigA-related protein, partial [Phycisphaerales bacterium]
MSKRSGSAKGESAEPARIEALRDLLRRADRAYYVDADPIMSDPEYDRLLAELAALEAKYPLLADPDSPTCRVGGEPIEGFETARHA